MANWDNPMYRKGWFAGKNRYGNKQLGQRLLWILVGFTLREIVLFALWMLLHS
jgi:hypothetical protein